MISFFRKQEKNQVKSLIFSNKAKTSKVALLSFTGSIKDQIINNFNTNYLIEGDHIKNGGKASKAPLFSLIGAGSALGMSAATSSTLFMATANPATLMTIGSGVSSAVMGAGGIVAQAPFIALSGAVMPVVAPLIAFQALSSIIILNRFKEIDNRLNNIESKLGTIIKRDIADDIGKIISSSNRIVEIENQFSICNNFTTDMIIRLSLIEDTVNPIFEKYSFLYKNRVKDESINENLVALQINDAMLTILVSILDLRIDLMKLRLTIQENPGYLGTAAKSLVSKVSLYSSLWEEILNTKNELSQISQELTDAVNSMNWWERNLPPFLFGKRKQRLESEKKSQMLDKGAIDASNKLDRNAYDAIGIGQRIKKPFEESQKYYMNLFYWKDETGEYSYYTSDLNESLKFLK